MRYIITTKGFRLPQSLHQLLIKKLEKTAKRLPDLSRDLQRIIIMIKKDQNLYFPKKHYHPAFRNYFDKTSSLARFEGKFDLKLPLNRLYVSSKGQSLRECINSGTDRLLQEIQKYKDRHFKSRSRYPNHSTIRST